MIFSTWTIKFFMVFNPELIQPGNWEQVALRARFLPSEARQGMQRKAILKKLFEALISTSCVFFSYSFVLHAYLAFRKHWLPGSWPIWSILWLFSPLSPSLVINYILLPDTTFLDSDLRQHLGWPQNLKSRNEGSGLFLLGTKQLWGCFLILCSRVKMLPASINMT